MDVGAQGLAEPQETVETESMQSSSAVMSDSADPKMDVSSEEGSYDVIKHKGSCFQPIDNSPLQSHSEL